MKLVKSDKWASLKSETLSDLLTVHLSSASLADFDPAPDIKHVGCLRAWRLAFMRQRDLQRRDDCGDEAIRTCNLSLSLSVSHNIK